MTQVRKSTQHHDGLGHELRQWLWHLVAGDPGSPTTAQFWYDTVANRFKVRVSGATKTLAHTDEVGTGTVTGVTGTAPIVSSGGTAPAISITAASGSAAGSMSTAHYTLVNAATASATASTLVQRDANSRIQLADPSSATDAATKQYVDAVAAGVRDPKDSVRVVATTNGTLATAYENGDTVDGVVLATGDRILLAGQTTGADNGIYVVAASGAPARATDADTSAEVTGGMYVWVNEGTANADTGWLLTTNDPITLATTALVFTQVSGLGQITAGGGVGKTGNTLSVAAGTGLSQDADGLSIDTTLTARYKTFTLGDGAATTFALTHSFGRKIVKVTVSDTTDDTEWEVGVTFTSTTQVTLDFGATVPTTNQFTALVEG